MNQINLVAIGIVFGMVGFVVGLIIWLSWRGRKSGSHHAGYDGKKAHQKRMDRPDIRP